MPTFYIFGLIYASVMGIADVYCDKMSWVTCQRSRNSQFSDSTGTIKTAPSNDKKMAAIKLVAKGEAPRHVDQIIESWKHKGTWRAKIESIGLERHPDCSSQKLERRGVCENLVRSVLSDLMVTEALRGVRVDSSLLGSDARSVSIEALIRMQKDDAFKQASGEVRQFVISNTPSSHREQTLAAQFDDVKSAMVSVIKRKFSSGDVRESMLKKVEGVQFGGTDCRDDNFNDLTEYYWVNAYYLPRENKVYMCQGAVDSMGSDWATYFILGHELGHSIDPCHIGQASKASPPQNDQAAIAAHPHSNFLGCLRSKNGPNAVHIETPFSTDRYDAGVFCTGVDQIGEVAADWFGAEVLAELLRKGKLGPRDSSSVRKGMANVHALACYHGQTDNGLVDVHLETSDRIDRILNVQPELRAAMGCPSSAEFDYCSNAEGPSTSNQRPASTATGSMK